MHLGQYAQAVQAFDQGWRNDPADSTMLNNKGCALLMCEDPLGALDAFNRAIEADPGNSSFLVNRGRALASQGKYEDALIALDQAIEIDDNNGQAWKYRAMYSTN